VSVTVSLRPAVAARGGGAPVWRCMRT